MTETFQFIVPSELNILIFVHYLQYFLEKEESEEIQATQTIIVPIQYQAYLKFDYTLFQMPIYDCHIFIISIVKVIGVLNAYIIYFKNLSFNAYTLITHTLTP